MQTHPQSTKNPQLSSLQNETPLQEESLHVELAAQQNNLQEVEQEKTESQVKAQMCSTVWYLIVLSVLAAFIAAQIKVQQQISNKNTDKFVKNMQLLKQAVIRENKQAPSSISTSSKVQQNNQNLNKYQPSQIASTAAKDKKVPIKKNLQNRLMVGSGIPQILLSKAQLRRTLTMLPFNQSNKISEQQYIYYQQKYKISQYDQLPFCIVVPTFNNGQNQRYLRNIRSVVMQNYSNYHIVVVDDASTDSTGTQILNFFLTQHKIPKERYEIIRNEQRMRAMHNVRFAANNYCKPNDIFMIVDGDDELVGRQVLKLFNANFQQEGLYFMYTNFLTPMGRAGYSRPFPQRIITNNNYRKYPFVTSHLRAFYTKLFLNIQEKDLRDENGEYFKAANDVAICLPILEQAHERVTYIPEVTYYYNSNTGLNNHALRLKQQRSNERKVRAHQKYEEVADLFADQ